MREKLVLVEFLSLAQCWILFYNASSHSVSDFCMLDYFGVFTLHSPPTSDIDRIFNCVCDLFACVYTMGTLVYGLIRRTLVESAQNLTQENSQGGCKA